MLPSAPSVVPHEWDAVGRAWTGGRDALWRRRSDALNAGLCRRWLRPTARPLLKTDLFDEAVSVGLVGVLRGLTPRVVAIDASPVVAMHARRRDRHLMATVADVRALPLADGALGAVVSNSTLDHFQAAHEIEAALCELHRALAPGGQLLLTLDNPHHPLVALRNALPAPWLRRLGLVPYPVGATLGLAAAERALAQAGFRVVSRASIEHSLRVFTVVLTRWVERLPAAAHAPWLRCLEWCEGLDRLPTRWRTGHYLALLAEKR